MKLAVSSASFDAALSAGSLTQLEWLDLCARDLALDGVVFDARHFPRTDDDYLAQLKKLAVDLGLTVAGLRCDDLLGRDEAGAAAALEIAWNLGAPLVLTRAAEAAGDDAGAWSRVVDGARNAAGAAKRRNVVVAVRNAAGTQCASAADLKRLAKDVDGSWLRYALDAAALQTPETPDPLLPKTVIALHDATGADDAAAAVAALGDFRAFLVLDVAPAAGQPALAAAVAAARRAIALA